MVADLYPSKVMGLLQDSTYGPVNPQLVCPHCGVQGHVRAKSAKAKQGISGGKATGALLTGGVSILATGLSRKQRVTQCRCDNCTTSWQIA